MDKARKKTDAMLKNLERRVSSIYASDSSLLRIKKKYYKYMNGVKKATQKKYDAYINAPYGEERNALKKEYVDEIRRLTIESNKYRKLIEEFCEIMAEVNQKALNLVNDDMTQVYALNYNQVAVDCRKVGIKVNG